MRDQVDKAEMDVILPELGDFFGVFMDSGRCASGLALLWDKSMDITLLSSSFNHIDARIRWEGEGSFWHFSGIYG